MTQRTRLRWNGDADLRGIREGALRGLLLGAEHVLAEPPKARAERRGYPRTVRNRVG